MTAGKIAALALLLALSRPGALRAEDRWAVTLYGGKTSFTSFMDVVRFNTDSRRSYLATLALSREFARWGENLAWEWETNVVKHSGMQDHFEFNALLFLRWHRFPWDGFVDTTFGLGAGPSYALEKPPVEIAQHETVSKLLNQLSAELTFARPGDSRWSAVIRIHHRSGANGVIRGVSGGSNFYCAGIRYHF